MRRTEDQDAFGRGLQHAFQDGGRAHEIVERDDGFVEAIRSEGYFEGPADWSPAVAKLVGRARGRVLDVGLGAGQHALALQARGLEVTGIDVSPACVELCRERGVRDVRLCSARQIGPHLGSFDTVLMMGNNLGFLESATRGPRLLERLARVTAPDGVILAETIHPYTTTTPEHLLYHQRNRDRGRMGGQIRLRVRWRKLKTPWFDYLMLSPDELEAMVAPTAWRIAHIYGTPDDGPYCVELAKK